MAEIKFEEALEKLEKIVSTLERGELPLDDSLKKYEEGIRLSRLCVQKLEEAEGKVEILIASGEGKKRIPFNVSRAEKEGSGKGEEGEQEGKNEGMLF